MNSTNREQPGNYLRKPLGKGTGMSIRTSATLRNCKRQDREKNESPQQFADRCKNLAQKVMIKSTDPQIQHIHKENADRTLLASFVSGLTGTAGTKSPKENQMIIPFPGQGQSQYLCNKH